MNDVTLTISEVPFIFAKTDKITVAVRMENHGHLAKVGYGFGTLSGVHIHVKFEEHL